MQQQPIRLGASDEGLKPNNERKENKSFSLGLFIFIKEEYLMNKKVFRTSGTCSKEISFDYEDGKMYNLSFVGGCNGNLKAIAILVEGMDAKRVVELLEGNTCGPKPTSCADQLAKAIKERI